MNRTLVNKRERAIRSCEAIAVERSPFDYFKVYVRVSFRVYSVAVGYDGVTLAPAPYLATDDRPDPGKFPPTRRLSERSVTGLAARACARAAVLCVPK